MEKRPRYPGSRPFTAADSPVFFGRDGDIRKLTTQIQVEPLTVLYGRSGLGKSSLINAGVAPLLEREHNYVVIPIRFTSYLPGVSSLPLVIFEQRLLQIPGRGDVLSRVENEAPSIWQCFKGIQLANLDKRAILLVFDQFEELFSYPQGVSDFAEALADLLYDRMPQGFRQALQLRTRYDPNLITDEEWALLKAGPPAHALLSIRSDKMSLIESLSGSLPNILRNCCEINNLTRSEATDAITCPAAKEGDFLSPQFSYEEEALGRILGFLSKDGETDIESFQLQILCQHVEEVIVLGRNDSHVESSDIGDLGEIYKSYYESSIQKLPADTREAAKILIEEGLVFEDDKRRLSLYEGQIQRDYGVGPELLRNLVDTHLIRAEPHTGGGYAYEVSHDSLVGPILRAKQRRLEARTLEDLEKRSLEKRNLKKRKVRRLGIGCGIYVVGTVPLLLWAFSGNSGTTGLECFFSILLIIPYAIYLLLSVLGPFYLIHEYVTEESLMSRWRRWRAAKKNRPAEV